MLVLPAGAAAAGDLHPVLNRQLIIAISCMLCSASLLLLPVVVNMNPSSSFWKPPHPLHVTLCISAASASAGGGQPAPL
jgi:hypothetical protein